MKKATIFKVFVSQEISKPLVDIHPSFNFRCEFDTDVESTYNVVFDMENRIQRLYKVLCELGCRCSVSREEFTQLFDNSIDFVNDN